MKNIYYLAFDWKSLVVSDRRYLGKQKYKAKQEMWLFPTFLEDDSGRMGTNYSPLLIRTELGKVNWCYRKDDWGFMQYLGNVANRDV